jgi:hypothetical protein
MRPSGAGGMLVMLAVAWIAVALIAWGALVLDRWNQVSYPDSLWLFVAIGVVAVAPAVGRVSRTPRDADAWGAQALLVPTALVVVETLTGPGCPTGGSCAAIGARGSLGVPGTILVIALAAVSAWGLARWQQRVAEDKRPQHARVRGGATALFMVTLMVFPGSVIAVGLVGLDLWLRSMPSLVASASTEVERECYGLLDAPTLAVRTAPAGYNPAWTTFAVRRADESRPGIDKKPLPSDWANLDEVYPYEATVSFNRDGELVTLSCRLIGPASGNAIADDLESTEPDSNPLSPKMTGAQFLPRFFTQGIAGPTEEGKQLIADRAKAAAKAEAKKSDAKPDAKPADAK